MGLLPRNICNGWLCNRASTISKSVLHLSITVIWVANWHLHHGNRPLNHSNRHLHHGYAYFSNRGMQIQGLHIGYHKVNASFTLYLNKTYVCTTVTNDYIMVSGMYIIFYHPQSYTLFYTIPLFIQQLTRCVHIFLLLTL